MQTISFNELPTAVQDLSLKIDMILARLTTKHEPEQDPLLTISQLADYLPEKPARQTIYGWVCQRKIPYEKYGRTLYFRKSKVDAWLENGRRV